MRLDSYDVSKVTGYIVTKNLKKAGEKGIRNGNQPWVNDTSVLLYIDKTTTLKAWQRFHHSKGQTFEQKIYFNKATGKKISLKTEPSKSYPGDGAFTLVNGVQNEKGFARSKEFIGFSGEDCEATIDLGKTETISTTIVHSLRRTSSWIWRPLTVEVQTSADGISYTFAGLTDDFIATKNSADNGIMKVSFDAKQARFIKVIIKCWDEIPAGEPGAGKKPWLFVDEIEVN
jgi:hexosaminidase